MRMLRLAVASLIVVFGCTSEEASFPRVERDLPVVAWTGDRVFVYGGSREPPTTGTSWPAPYGDAALWNPATGDYEAIAEPPFELPLNVGAGAVVADGSVVLVGALCETVAYTPDNASTRCDPGTLAAARYSIDDDWRVLTPPPDLAAYENASITGLGATSDGRAVFSVASRGRRLWAVDGDDRWEALPPYPGTVQAYVGPLCLAGDTVIAASRNPDRAVVHFAMALDDATPRWRELDAPEGRLCGEPDPLVEWPPGGTEPVVTGLRE